MTSNHPSDVLILIPHRGLDTTPTMLDATEDSPRWALVLDSLLNPSPGRTLNQLYSGLGRIAEKQANQAAHSVGLGPQPVAQRIRRYFGDGENRVRQLDLLHNSKALPKIEKHCRKLMSYALPCVCSICCRASLRI
jgi:hypothetical protein